MNVTRADDQLPERIGFGIELGGRRGLPVRQRFGREPRLVDEVTLDPLADGSAARSTTPG